VVSGSGQSSRNGGRGLSWSCGNFHGESAGVVFAIYISSVESARVDLVGERLLGLHEGIKEALCESHEDPAFAAGCLLRHIRKTPGWFGCSYECAFGQAWGRQRVLLPVLAQDSTWALNYLFGDSPKEDDPTTP
jgi:hypothetical protein